jgi:hypothetical protein
LPLPGTAILSFARSLACACDRTVAPSASTTSSARPSVVVLYLAIRAPLAEVWLPM